jgi:hypothetical protein
MKRPNAAKREPVDGPTELELLEFAKQTPLDAQAMAQAVYSLTYATQGSQASEAYKTIARLLRKQAILARFYWQIFHEVCGTPVSLPDDAPDYTPPEVLVWIQALVDGTSMISGREAARFLGWTRPTLIKTWNSFVPKAFKFSEGDSYSESFLKRVAALRAEDERKKKADRQKDRRAREKPTQEKSEKL